MVSNYLAISKSIGIRKTLVLCFTVIMMLFTTLYSILPFTSIKYNDVIFETIRNFGFLLLMINSIYNSYKGKINNHINTSKIDFYADMYADLEFINNLELRNKLKREWLPGLLELIFTDPVTVWRTISQRFRIR